MNKFKKLLLVIVASITALIGLVAFLTKIFF